MYQLSRLTQLVRVGLVLSAIGGLSGFNLLVANSATQARLVLIRGDRDSGGMAASERTAHGSPFIPAPQPYGVEVVWPVATGYIEALVDLPPAQPLNPKIDESNESILLPKTRVTWSQTETDMAIQTAIG